MEIFNLPTSHRNNPNIDGDLRALINKKHGFGDNVSVTNRSRNSLHDSHSRGGKSREILPPILQEQAAELGGAIQPVLASATGFVEKEVIEPLKFLGRRHKIAPFNQAYLGRNTDNQSFRSRSPLRNDSTPVKLARSKRGKRNQLFKAAAENDLSTVKSVCTGLEKQELLEDTWREPGTERTALHAALESYSVEVSEYLMDYGGQDLIEADYKVKIGVRTGKQTTLHALVQSADSTDSNRTRLLNKLLGRLQTGILKRLKDAEFLDKFTIRVDPDHDGYARYYTALHIAAYKGDLQMVETLVHAGATIDASYNNGATPLFFSIRYGHIQTTEKLIKLGAQVNFTTYNGSTPIHWAVRYEKPNIVKLLLDKGATHEKARRHGFGLPFILAAALGNTDIIDIFIAHGVDVNVANQNARTALHFAAAMGHSNIIQQLDSSSVDSLLQPIKMKMKKNVLKLDYNATDKLGTTPLMFAVRGGHPDTVAALLDSGATLGQINVLNQSVWTYALQIDDKEVQKTVLELLCIYHQRGYRSVNRTLSIDQENGEESSGIEVKLSPLNQLAVKNDPALINSILEYRVRADEYEADGTNFIHVAAEENCTALLSEILQSWTLPSDSHVINKLSVQGETPLMVAARTDNEQAAKCLVSSRNINLLAVNPISEMTAIHIAVINSPKVTSVILAKAKESNVLSQLAEFEDENGNNLLHLAARVGNIEVITSLVGMVDLDLPNDFGDSALHLAIWYSQRQAVLFLLKHANIGIRDHYGRTPLHVASSIPGSPPELIQDIISAIHASGNESLIDATDDLGCTALHLAARKGKPETATLLKDIDPGLLNNGGNMALHVAAIRHRPAYLQALLSVHGRYSSMTVDQKNQDEATVLHICARNGDCESIKKLLRCGADLTEVNKHGDTVLHAVVAETVVEPEKMELMLQVYHTILNEVVCWWCKARKVEYPDEASTTYRNIKRYAMLELTSHVKNREGMTVIALATALGASMILETILNTENVYKFSVTTTDYGVPQWMYDVTHLTPGADPKIVAKGISTEYHHEGPGVVGSCLDILSSMDSNLTAAQILEITPLRQLVQNYWSAYQWIYGVMMLIHIIYMILYTIFSFKILETDVTHSSGQKAAYGMFLLWPAMLFFFELYYQGAKVRAWWKGRKQVKVIRKAQETVGGPVGHVAKATKSVVHAAAAVFDNLPHLGATVLAIFVLVWYLLYLVNNHNQVYIICVVLIIGWLYATSFTKGFKTVHAFNTMVKYIVIRDMARFIFIYLFILLAFGLALHALFVAAPFTRIIYTSAFDTIFMTFNLMLGMGELFLTEDFDTAYESAGFDPVVPKIVYLIYMILATIIFLNLLIAMMTDTYANVKSNEARTWQISTVTLAVRIERKMGFIRRFLSYINALSIKFKLVKLESPQRSYVGGNQTMFRIMTMLSNDQIFKGQPNLEELAIQRLENKLDALTRNQSQISSKVEDLFKTVKKMEENPQKSKNSDLL